MRERAYATSKTAAPAVLLFVWLLTIATAMLSLGGCGAEGRKTPSAAGDRLVVITASGRHELSIELADTDQKKQTGLMFRTSLGAGHGMLFPYDGPQEITMWMRNTYISLDMVFIGADGVVVSVARNTEPMSEAIISSKVPATGVLEVKAGEADRLGIVPGSRVEHAHFKGPVAPP